jgi:competence protein ComEC
MIWGALATLAGLIYRPLGQVLGWVAWAFLAYTTGAVRLMARIPNASVPVRFPGGAVVVYYTLLATVLGWIALTPERREELRQRLAGRKWASIAVVVGLVVIVLGVAWLGARPDGQLHVVFLDVGQGDAIFIQTPSGRQALIDGGPSESALLDQLGRQMPFWDRSLDVVLLTHPDLDHVTGLLPVLERYQVRRIVYRDVEAAAAEYERWVALAAAEGTEVFSGQSGLQLDLGYGVRLAVLHPGAELGDGGGFGHNNASVVTRLTYGSIAMLLPGDIEAEVERRLLADGAPLRSNVLKLAHHGSCTSTSEEFLEAVSPDVAVISVGENDFGHPCQAVLDRLGGWPVGEGSGLPVYRTDRDGTIEVISDGTKVWVRTEH